MSSANSQQSSDAAPSIKEEQPARSIVKNSSRIPPEHPIEYWEKRLIGKRMIPQDAEGDEMTFKKSDLPEIYETFPGAHGSIRMTNRLQIFFNPDRVVRNVHYG